MTTFVYDAENRLSTRTLPNGVVTTYQYDVRDRPLSVVHRNAGGTVLASRTYVRAAGGEPTQITKEDGSYVLVGYDSALRIISERYFDEVGTLESEISYGYDADGNRVSKTVDGVVSSYAYASGSRLTGITTNGVTASRTIDNGGRETALAVMSKQLALTYDSDDHVSRVVDTTSGTTTDFGFDAAGRRTSVTQSGNTKRFLTAPNVGDGYESPQAITDASGNVLASFVFAGEMPLMKIVGGQAVYYLGDAMGTVLATAGASGAVAESFEYDAFGNARSADALPTSTHGDFRFQGMWKDPSGLYYVRARVYDAETGRFTSRDPAKGWASEPETHLPYAFANSCPSVWSDPSGLFSLKEFGATLAGIATLASQALNRLGERFLAVVRTAVQAGANILQLARNIVDPARATLLRELAQQGVKHDPRAIIAVQRIGERILFLERGNLRAGLQHIIERHGAEFLARGIPQSRIPEMLFTALRYGKVVGYQGSGAGRPIYEFVYNGVLQRVAITVGSNGYIVGANPVSLP